MPDAFDSSRSPSPTPTAHFRDLLDLTREELAAGLFAAGLNPVHAEAVWSGVHRELATDVDRISSAPERVRRFLREGDYRVGTVRVRRTLHSADGFTRKFLLELDDGETVETVLMHYAGRATACVSTQAGCAMGCVFCATGQAGFRRQLSAGEIVAQAHHVARELAASGAGARLRNVVLMGQGEPLHNYDAVMRAVETLADPRGLALAHKRITLSTVGLVPGIRRLADERRPLSLAVSLHAATDEERQALVPVARRWPLAEVMEACRHYSAQTGRRVFFEWTLIAGRNDRPQQAEALARLLRGQSAQINLIPLNPSAGFAGAPSAANDARAFQAILRQHGFPVTIRQRRGIDIAAGCGQLAGAERG